MSTEKSAFVGGKMLNHLTGHGEDGVGPHITNLKGNPADLGKNLLAFAEETEKDVGGYLNFFKNMAIAVGNIYPNLTKVIPFISNITSMREYDLNKMIIPSIQKFLANPNPNNNPVLGEAEKHIFTVYRLLTDHKSRNALIDLGVKMKGMKEFLELLGKAKGKNEYEALIREPEGSKDLQTLEDLAGQFLAQHSSSLQLPMSHISSLIPKLDAIAGKLETMKLSSLAEELDIVANTLEKFQK
jgi:hypothetical protein